MVTSLQIQRSFELQDELNFSDAGSNLALSFRRDGRLFSISPAIAVRMTDAFSVGVAFNVWPNIFDNGWETDTVFRAGNEEVRSKSNFDFEGFNITAGFLWQANPWFTIGGVFRSPFDATVTHRNTLSRNIEDTTFTETLTMEMPLSYGLGLAARLSDFFTVSLDVSWVEWSDFRLQTPDSSFFFSIPSNGIMTDVVVLPDFRDAARNNTTSVRLGFEYLWDRPEFLAWLQSDNFVIPVRAGLFYDPEPSFEGDDDFWGVSLGAGIFVWGFKVDIAYTFRTGRRTKLVTRTGDTVEEERARIYEHNFLVAMIYDFSHLIPGNDNR